MMTIENGSVWSDLQGARLPGTKCEFDGFGSELAERFELHRIHNIFGMQEAQSWSLRGVHLVLHVIVDESKKMSNQKRV